MVRASTFDLSKIYIFDAKSDVFLGVVNETIGVFGDAQSMKEHPEDRQAISRHCTKLKQIDDECNARFEETQYPEESLDEIDLEVITNEFYNSKIATI